MSKLGALSIQTMPGMILGDVHLPSVVSEIWCWPIPFNGGKPQKLSPVPKRSLWWICFDHLWILRELITMVVAKCRYPIIPYHVWMLSHQMVVHHWLLTLIITITINHRPPMVRVMRATWWTNHLGTTIITRQQCQVNYCNQQLNSTI